VKTISIPERKRLKIKNWKLAQKGYPSQFGINFPKSIYTGFHLVDFSLIFAADLLFSQA
jgi:hypothetical protein